MERVKFQYKRGGRIVTVNMRQAEVLSRRGLGELANRSMEDKPQVTKVEARLDTGSNHSVEASLDTMDKEALHALAKERGVKVHHAAGADKVRQALRDAA